MVKRKWQVSLAHWLHLFRKIWMIKKLTLDFDWQNSLLKCFFSWPNFFCLHINTFLVPYLYSNKLIAASSFSFLGLTLLLGLFLLDFHLLYYQSCKCSFTNRIWNSERFETMKWRLLLVISWFMSLERGQTSISLTSRINSLCRWNVVKWMSCLKSLMPFYPKIPANFKNWT